MDPAKLPPHKGHTWTLWCTVLTRTHTALRMSSWNFTCPSHWGQLSQPRRGLLMIVSLLFLRYQWLSWTPGPPRSVLLVNICCFCGRERDVEGKAKHFESKRSDCTKGFLDIQNGSPRCSLRLSLRVLSRSLRDWCQV